MLSVLSHSTAASYGLQLGLQKKSCDSSVPSRFFFFFFFSVLKLDTSRRVKYKTPTPTTMADLDPQWPRFSVTTTTCREKTKYHITPCQAMYHGYYIHIYRSMPCRYPDLGHKAQRSSRYPDLGHKPNVRLGTQILVIRPNIFLGAQILVLRPNFRLGTHILVRLLVHYLAGLDAAQILVRPHTFIPWKAYTFPRSWLGPVFTLSVAGLHSAQSCV